MRLLKRAGVAPKELVHIYLASIRSIIEYAAPTWFFPSTRYLIAQLEAIQRRVLRIIFPHFKYADALKMANIPTIHLIPKWRPISYSFVCMFISPLCLIFTPKFFCVFYMLTRHQGLVNMQTKEKFIGRHFGIRCIEQRLHTISISYFKQMKSNEHKLNHLFPLLYQNQYSTRSQAKGIVAVPPARTKREASSFIIKAS